MKSNTGTGTITPSTSRVRIHIDRAPYDSVNPTTNESLYALARIPKGRTLFREAPGNRDDQEVPRDESSIHLAVDERLFSAEWEVRELVVVVNGQKKVVHKLKLSFMELVALAFNPLPTGPNWYFTITYRNGPVSNPQGTLLEGHFVRLQKGMVFNVTATDKS